MERVEFEKIPGGFFAASVVTVGNFDGVHLGHRRIISTAVEKARDLDVPSAVITFDPHPWEVVNRGQIMPSIFPLEERARRISELGVDCLVKVNFTPEFASCPAGTFVSEMAEKLSPRVVVIGYDFRFGRGREGNEEFLRREGEKLGFEVVSVPVVSVMDKPVSSTRIRGLIQAGEMRRARRLLGAPFQIDGEVIKGHGRGKGLGFATANLRWETRLIPPEGVYAAVALWNGERFPAVVNIGSNPTFGDSAVSIEAHIMGFSGDLYAKRIRIELYRRLRGEVRFDSPEALADQIKKDVEKARQTLTEEVGQDLFERAGGGKG